MRLTFMRKSRYFFLKMQCEKDGWDKFAGRMKKTPSVAPEVLLLV